jgi:hypothetical protein
MTSCGSDTEKSILSQASLSSWLSSSFFFKRRKGEFVYVEPRKAQGAGKTAR